MVMLEMICLFYGRVFWEMGEVKLRELKRGIIFILNLFLILLIWILKLFKINRLCDFRESWERKFIYLLRKFAVF